MMYRHPRDVGLFPVETPGQTDEEFAGEIDTFTERSALRRRAAIRVAARYRVSYEEGARIRDNVLREAIAQTIGTRASEAEVVWQNIIPGTQERET